MMLLNNEDAFFSVLSFFVHPNAFRSPSESGSGPGIGGFGLRPASGGMSGGGSHCSVVSARRSNLEDIASLFRVSKVFRDKMGEKRLWGKMWDSITCCNGRSSTAPRLIPSPPRPAVMSRFALNFGAPSTPTRPTLVQSSKVEPIHSSRIEINSLVSFVSLGLKHVGSEGELVKIRERSTGKHFAMKKTKGKTKSSLIGSGSETSMHESLPYPVLREISVLKSLKVRNHANISFLRGVKLIKGDLYRFYDYIPSTMRDQIDIARAKKFRAFSLTQIKSLFRQLLSGLSGLHSHGIIHRNLKPMHLLLDYSHGPDRINLKISDFALVRTSSFPAKDFTPDQVTLWYRPPEILMGDRKYSTAVDLWSAGCILGELFQGIALFRDKSEIGILFKIFKAVGSPDSSLWERLSSLPNYNSMAFPDWPVGNLARFFNDKCSQEMTSSGAMDLLLNLLSNDPTDRLQAKSSLTHYFFDDLSSSVSLTSPPPQAAKNRTAAVIAANLENRLVGYHNLMREEEAVCGLVMMKDKKVNHVRSLHREILVDWLIEIVDVFDLSFRTGHLAMAYLDRFYRNRPVDVKKLQLIGATCLLIASKCEDIQFIGTKDLAFCGDNTYKIRDIVEMERKILTTLKFEISIPTAYDFVSVQVDFVEEIGSKPVVRALAGFLSEIALQGQTHLHFEPSLIATGICSLALILKNEHPFPTKLQLISGYRFLDLKAVIEQLWQESLRLQTYTNIEFLTKRWKKKEYSWIGGWEFHTIHWDWDEQVTKIILLENAAK